MESVISSAKTAPGAIHNVLMNKKIKQTINYPAASSGVLE